MSIGQRILSLHDPLRWVLMFVLLPALALAFAPAARAGAPEAADAGLNEDVVMIPAGASTPELEVTVYRPRGNGPFPLAIINHGRSPGPAYMQARYRPSHVAYEFVRRGYAVVVPMRQGFSRSGGIEFDASCDVATNGRQQARSVRRAVDWASAQPWADAQNNIVIGQSHGGLATLAYGEDPHPGTRLLVNFAGGLRQAGCPGWEEALVEAMGSYARATQLPSLWFYGDNDSHFRPAMWRAAHGRYVQQGGHASLEAFGRFGNDAHTLFGARDGLPVWLPTVTRALASAGLPSEPDPKRELIPDLPQQLPLRLAKADEVERLPVRSHAARQGFLEWLRLTVPKAFAISESGRFWASAWGVARPIVNALEHCERMSGGRCRLIGVNGYIVSSGDSGTD